MSDEKNLNEENNESVNNEEQTPVETEETTAEQAEETVETPAETEETPVETEVSETAETEETPAVAEENTDVEVDEAVAAAQAAFENVQKDEQKKGGKGGLIAIIVAAVIVVAIVVVLAVKFGPSMFNKYNRLGYVDVQLHRLQKNREWTLTNSLNSLIYRQICLVTQQNQLLITVFLYQKWQKCTVWTLIQSKKC